MASLAVWAAWALSPDHAAFWVVGLIGLIVATGWPGTERIWYLRIFRGQRFRWWEARRLTFAFFMPFAVLGFLVFTPGTVLIVVLWNLGLLDSHIPLLIALTGWGVMTDVVLTFVTPALAYTCPRVRDAIRSGIRMIFTEWPKSAWYVLTPPLAAVIVASGLRPFRKPIGVAVGGGIAVLVNLLMKGATAAFFLRRAKVGDDGAAFLGRGERRSEGPPSVVVIPERPDQ